MTTITLRQAEPADIDWIIQQESRGEFAAFIHRWPRAQHERNLSDRDMRYLIGIHSGIESGNEPAAFVILAGLDSAARSTELVRMAVTTPGRGLGRDLLSAVIDLVFDDMKANRLWLDVFDDNTRARRAYQRAGFREEGLLREAAMRADGTLGSLVVMSILARERATSS